MGVNFLIAFPFLLGDVPLNYEFGFRILIYIVAGIGAGFATGFSGISAALVISPMLVSFLDFDAYDAVGIALLANVPAAAFSAWFYQKKGHLRIRESLMLLISVLLFTFAGSWVSQYVPSPALGSVSIVWSLIMGIKFLFLPNISTAKLQEEQSAAEKITFTVVMGAVVGFISGFAGAGGGMMTLFVLTTFLNFEIKDAVGTSVFIMTFTSLVGGVSHLSIGGVPDLWALFICTLFTLGSAILCSRAANNADSSKLNRITGIFLTVLGVIMTLSHFFF